MEEMSDEADQQQQTQDELERLLSEKLLQGFCLLEQSCPACTTPLVKIDIASLSSFPSGKSDAKGSLSRTLSDDTTRSMGAVPGVPFCVACQAHVVTHTHEVELLENTHNTKRGTVLVVPENSIDDDDEKEGKSVQSSYNSKSSFSSTSRVSGDDASWISKTQKEEFEVLLCDDEEDEEKTTSSFSSSIRNASTGATSKGNSAKSFVVRDHQKLATQQQDLEPMNSKPSVKDSKNSSQGNREREDLSEKSQSSTGKSMERNWSREERVVELAISQSESFRSNRSNLSKPTTDTKSKKAHESDEFVMPEYAEVRQVATKVLASKMVKGYCLSQDQCEACSMPLLQLHDELVSSCFVCETLLRKHKKRLEKEQNRQYAREEVDKAVAPLLRETLPESVREGAVQKDDHDKSISSTSKRSSVKDMVGLWNNRNRPSLNASPIQPPTEAEKEKLEEEADKKYNELKDAETKIHDLEEKIKNTANKSNVDSTNAITLTPREAELVQKIAESNETVVGKTRELLALDRQRNDILASLDTSSNGYKSALLDDSKIVQQRKIQQQELHTKQEIERAMRAREVAEIEARRLADEKRALSEALALSQLEKDAEEKQRIAEEAVEKARLALERIRVERHKMYAKMIAEGETQAVAEVEQVVRAQAEDYYENKPFPTELELQRERWEILRTEARSVMTRRMMAGWTPLPELCRGKECGSSPLLTDGSIKQCVVCGGCGNGHDGVYAAQVREKDDENDVHAPSQEFLSKEEIDKLHSQFDHESLKPPREISMGPCSPLPMSPTGTISLQELQEDFDTKRDMVSKEISKRMMKGWALLDSTCPRCVMPLMTDVSKESEICVLCGLVGKLAKPAGHHDSSALQSSSSLIRGATSQGNHVSSNVSSSSKSSSSSSKKRKKLNANSMNKPSAVQKYSSSTNRSTKSEGSGKRSEKSKGSSKKAPSSSNIVDVQGNASSLNSKKQAQASTYDERLKASSLSSNNKSTFCVTKPERKSNKQKKEEQTPGRKEEQGSPRNLANPEAHTNIPKELISAMTTVQNEGALEWKKSVATKESKADIQLSKESSSDSYFIASVKNNFAQSAHHSEKTNDEMHKSLAGRLEPDLHTQPESLAKMIANLRPMSSSGIKKNDPPAVTNPFFFREGSVSRERPLSPGGTRADNMCSLSRVRGQRVQDSMNTRTAAATEVPALPDSAEQRMMEQRSAKGKKPAISTNERENAEIIFVEETDGQGKAKISQRNECLTLQIPKDFDVKDEKAIRRLIEAAKSPIHGSDPEMISPERHRLPSPGISVGSRPCLLSSPSSHSALLTSSDKRRECEMRASPHLEIESIVVPLMCSSASSGSGIDKSNKQHDANRIRPIPGHARRAPSPGLEADVHIPKTFSSASSSHFRSLSGSHDGSSVYGVGHYGRRIAPETLMRSSSTGKPRRPPHVPGQWNKRSSSSSRMIGRIDASHLQIPRNKFPRHPEDQPVIDVELLIQDDSEEIRERSLKGETSKIDGTLEKSNIVLGNHESGRFNEPSKADPPEKSVVSQASENRNDDDFTLFERQKSHSREDSSVNTDTLDALLSRIEKTQSQMEQTAACKPKSKGDNRNKSREHFRGLIYDLSRAADEMERLEKQGMPSE